MDGDERRARIRSHVQAMIRKGRPISEAARADVRVNARLFVDQLCVEREAERRSRLVSTLLREENKFARLSERLALLQEHIAAIEGRMARQRSIVSRVASHPGDLERAEDTLRTLTEVRATLGGAETDILASLRSIAL